MINNVVLQGRITRDIELRRTKNGKSYINFDIAVDSYKDEVDYFKITAWEKQATTIANYFHKGDMIVLSGSLKTETWQTKEGEKRSMVKVVLRDFGFCGSRKQKKQSNPMDDDFSFMVDDPVIF